MSRHIRITLAIVLPAVLFLLQHDIASAQLIVLDDRAQLDPLDVTTNAFPGSSTDFIAAPFTVGAGNNQVTLSAVNGSTFYRFDSDGAQVDFPAFTQLIATADTGFSPNGPLRLDFAQPVSEFGLSAQSFSLDTETFSVTAFAGNTSLGTFSTLATDNASGSGAALFLGARAPSDVITSVVISSLSDVAGQNDGFFAGPITLSPVGSINASVPEPGGLTFAICSGSVALLYVRGIALRNHRPTGPRFWPHLNVRAGVQGWR